MAKPVTKMTFEELEREYEVEFKSTHERAIREIGEEYYDFNIKMPIINIPDIVRKAFTEKEIDDRVGSEMKGDLENFIGWVKDNYDWVVDVDQVGRSGGWLLVGTDIPAFILSFEQGASRNFVRGRIRDLREIEKAVEEGKKDLVERLKDEDFWEISPRDWSPRWRK